MYEIKNEKALCDSYSPRMKFFWKFIQIYNSCAVDFRSSRVVYIVFILRIMQLASVINTCYPASYTSSNYSLETFFSLITLASPISWESIATNQAISILIGGFLMLHLLLCFQMLSFMFKRKLTEASQFWVLCYKIVNFLFEYSMLIPTLSWIMFDRLPVLSSTGLSSARLQKSPTWFVILVIALLGVNSALHLLSKLLELPFRRLFQDRLKSATLLFDLLNLLLPAAIVILAAKAQNNQIPSLSAPIVAVIFGLLNITMEFLYMGYRNPSSRRVHIYIMTAFFSHSLFILIAGKLSSTFRKTQEPYFGVVYFFSLSFLVKLSQIGDKRFLESNPILKTSILSKGSNAKRFEELMELMHQTEAPVSLRTHFREKAVINDHLISCKIDSCFCSTLKKEDVIFQIDNKNTKPTTEYLEFLYQSLLETDVKRNQYNLWPLLNFVLFQALNLEKPMKAVLILEHLKPTNPSLYEKIILDSLKSFLKNIHLKKLKNMSETEQDIHQVNLFDAIEVDRTYQKLSERLRKLHESAANFYEYLIEGSPINLNKVFTHGENFIKEAFNLEREIERLHKINEEDIEIISMLIEFRESVISRGRNSLRSLNHRLNALMIKKRYINHKQGLKTGSFDFFDRRNVYIAVDIIKSIGEFIHCSSNLSLYLGYNGTQHKMDIRKILPPGVGNDLIKTLQIYLNQTSSFEVTTKYFDLILLSDAENNLLPFQGYLKMEPIVDRELCGIAVFKPIKTSSQFILTNPSGEIVSSSKKLATWLQIESVDTIRGSNVCLMMPEVLRYYTDISEKNEDLYPIQNKRSVKFDSLTYIERNPSARQEFEGSSEAREILSCLHDLNGMPIGSVVDQNQISLIGEKLGKMRQNIDQRTYKVFQISLKIQKFSMNDKTYKVLEIFQCRDCFNQKKFAQDSFDQPFKNTVKDSMGRNVFASSNFLTLAEKANPEIINEGPNAISGNLAQENLTVTKHEGHKNSQSSSRNAVGSNDSSFGKDESDIEEEENEAFGSKRTRKVRLEKTRIKYERGKGKGVDPAPSVSGSARSEASEFQGLSGAIQNNLSYRIIDLNLYVGLIGVAIIVSLFTAQYVGYSNMLSELTLLCTSMSYPIELGTHLQMLTKDYYKWDLYSRGVLAPTSWFYQIIDTISFPTFVTVTASYAELILTPQNVSEDVNTFLMDPQNAIEMHFLDGGTINMSLPSATITLNQAGKTYYEYEVEKLTHDESSLRNGFLLEANTDSLFDTLVQMNVYLFNQIGNRIDAISSFNLILLVIVSLIIGLLAVCCIVMYLKFNAKKIKMLALFCTVPKSELIIEVQKLNEILRKTHKINKVQTLYSKDNPKNARRAYTEYTYKNKSKWTTLASFLLVFGIFLIPFSVVYSQTRIDVHQMEEGVNQINIWVQFESQVAAFLTQEFEYFRNVNATQEVKAVINDLKQQRLASLEVEIPLMENFMLSFGSYDDQNIYDAQTTQQIKGGLISVCIYTNHPSAFYNAVCKNISKGITNTSLLQTFDYFLSTSEQIYNSVLNSSNQSQTLNQFGQTPDILENDMMQNYLNRYLRITSDMMTVSIVTFMQDRSQQAFQRFLGILLSILIILTLGWIIWVKRMERLLNETKNLLMILPMRIIQNTGSIKSYFKQELKSSKNII